MPIKKFFLAENGVGEFLIDDDDDFTEAMVWATDRFGECGGSWISFQSLMHPFVAGGMFVVYDPEQAIEFRLRWC